MLRPWRATPLPRWRLRRPHLRDRLKALASGAVTVAAVALAYHARLSAGAALSLLVALTLGALAWASVGTAITAVIPTTDAAQPVLSLSYFPVMLLSGVLGAFSGAPSWLSTLLGYLPGQPTLDAVTRALYTTGTSLSLPGHDLAVLAGGPPARCSHPCACSNGNPEPRGSRRTSQGEDIERHDLAGCPDGDRPQHQLRPVRQARPVRPAAPRAGRDAGPRVRLLVADRARARPVTPSRPSTRSWTSSTAPRRSGSPSPPAHGGRPGRRPTSCHPRRPGPRRLPPVRRTAWCATAPAGCATGSATTSLPTSG